MPQERQREYKSDEDNKRNSNKVQSITDKKQFLLKNIGKIDTPQDPADSLCYFSFAISA